MKPEKLLPCLSAVALAVCLSFGGTACMVTGMNLQVNLFLLFLGCLVGAITVAVCLNIKWGGRILAIAAALIAMLMILIPGARESVVALLNKIISFYHRAYGVPIPEWMDGVTSEFLPLPLLLFGGLVSLLAVWTVLRSRDIAPAITLSLIPLFACLVVTDTVPAVLPILILLFGIVLLIMTQPVRQRNAAQGDKLTAILTVPVAAVLGLLLLAIPQDGYSADVHMDRLDAVMDWIASKIPFVAWTSDGKPVISFGGNISDEIDLGGLGHRDQSSAAVLEITADYSGTVYLRGMDYDKYTMTGWNSSEDRTESNFAPPLQWTQTDGTLTVRALSRRGQRYVPYYPMDGITFEDGALDNSPRLKEYSYRTRSLASDWASIWHWSHTGFGAGTTDSRYLKLPDSTRKKAELFLTQVGFNSADDALTVAQAIGSFVRYSASYDLETDRMPSSYSDFAMWFLEESDTGYCVHFASAATVLLRAAGIPARYVEGYAVDVSAGQTVLVRELHAHAWVEYYLEEVGWVILDPTPAAGEVPPTTNPPETTAPPVTEPPVTEPPVTEPPVTEPPVTEPPVTEPPVTEPPVTEPPVTDPSTPPSTDPSIIPTNPSTGETIPIGPSHPGTTPGTSSGTTGPVQTMSSGGSKPKSDPMPDWFLGILLTLLALGLAVLAVVAQWALRRRRKIQLMYYMGSSNEQAIIRYQESARMAKFLATAVPDELLALAEKARYSRHRLSDEELDPLDEYLRHSVRALRRLPFHKKLIAKLIYAFY